MRSYVEALFTNTNVLPWYHGRLSFATASRLLSARTDGLFLVRDSATTEDDFVLMVCYRQEIYQYKIKMQNNAFTINKVDLFETLEDLINHYRSKTSNANIFKTRLTNYVVKASETDLVPWKEIQIEGSFHGIFVGIITARCRGKRIILKSLKRPENAKLIMNRGLCHENLLNILGLTYFNYRYYFITEYPAYGNLLDLLKLPNPNKLSDEKKFVFAYDITSGMEYLEKMSILHKLLSTMNVLVTRYGVAKLTNYGLSEVLPPDYVRHYTRWQAPETISNKEHSSKSDIWSYGVCLWEIFTDAKTPYENIASADIYSTLESGTRLNAPGNCPEYFADIMDLCWKWAPADRPTFYELKEKLYPKKLEKYDEFIV